MHLAGADVYGQFLLGLAASLTNLPAADTVPADLVLTRFSGPEITPCVACLCVSAQGEVYAGVDLNGSLGKGPGKGRIVKQGTAVAILSYGARMQECLRAADMLDKQGLSTTVADARFAKPLDEALIAQLAKNHEMLITIEEGARGGFGAFVLHSLAERGLLDKGLRIRTLTLPDVFQDHDTPEKMYEFAGLDARSIAASAIKALGRGDERALKLIVG